MWYTEAFRLMLMPSFFGISFRTVGAVSVVGVAYYFVSICL